MRIDPYGDSALIVTFDREISKEVNQQVVNLYRNLKKDASFNSLIPAYNSLTLSYNRSSINFEKASQIVKQAYQDLVSNNYSHVESKTYTIPVCYDPCFGLDLIEVSRQTNLTIEEMIAAHTNQVYHVYLLGFVAGFAYMGSLPEALKCARKTTPRLSVPKGAVGLAGLQTGIYPTEAPGGWQIIGSTPLEMFNPNNKPSSFLQPGDAVRFRAIGKEEYRIIQLEIETEVFEMEGLYE
ncbi:5-oxoprolinase subunit PxpB [Roseivirga sp.]|uniref:5-oxoprolinase subunit PxpB n=1 Tax=Roseivirga sp. TaxID=1964215 RepID=UPI003B8E869F